MTYMKWTSDDIAYLRTHYFDDGANSVAKALGRTANSVKQKAKNMNVSSRRCPIQWDADMEAYLISHYHTDLNSDIAYHLGLKSFHVRLKAVKMGLSKPDGFLRKMKDVIDRKRAVSVEVAREEGRIPALSPEAGKAYRYKKGCSFPADEIKRRTETYNKTREAEARRVRWGLPQKTKLKIRQDK